MRVLRDAVLVLVGPVLFLSGIFVLLPYSGAGATGSEITGRGVAVATSCRFSGPVTEVGAPEPRFVFG